MDNKNIEIIYSLLGQVGGPLHYKDIGIIYEQKGNFYSNWDKFKDRAFNNLSLLSKVEKEFLLYIVSLINKKLDWEAQTVTGFQDGEREEAIKKLISELNVTVDLDKPLPELPHELMPEK